MKRRLGLFFAAAVLAAGAMAEDPPKPEEGPLLDDGVMRRLKQALDCVNLSVEDLGWDKRPLDDAFRLKCVNDTLDHPLHLADSARDAERDFAADPAASALAAARLLDLQKPADLRRDAHERVPAGMPVEAQVAFLELAALLDDSSTAVEGALAPLSEEERRLVREKGSRLYVGEDEEDQGDPMPLLGACQKVELQAFVDVFGKLAETAAEMRKAGAVLAGAKWEARTWEVATGVTVGIGGPGPDRFEDCAVVVDPGGDDTYVRCRFVLDCGGNDTYRDCAAALFGCALVVDLAGNDVYTGGNVCQGGAMFGASLLLDVAGDDRYEADQLSQGSGVFGVGMLFDLAGNDGYRGARFVQGFGGTRGLGALSDVAGNDTYYAGGKYSHAPLLPENFQSLSQGFGFGMRPSASGGVGILADHAGNDQYTAEVFGQGASYWFALGVLADSAGHDKYDLYQYGQGSGIHLSSGVLFDRAGNDAYSCNNGVAQGCGHDWAAGLLLDLAGNDYYQGAGMTHGGANANGFGILVDRAGNDAYSGVRPECQGWSFQSRGTFGLGVLLDLGGQDKYSLGTKDNTAWTKSWLGVGLDCEEPR